LSATHRIFSYIKYWLYAVNEHSLHAPFVYDLFNKVLKNNNYRLAEFDNVRKDFEKSSNSVEVEDYGAGSSYAGKTKRLISDIAAKGVINDKYGSLLYKLIKYTESKKIIELGTSLGISTLYLSKKSDTQVNTFEGSGKLLNIASSVFEGFERSNIKTHQGNIDDLLPEYLMRTDKIDFAFIDANHTRKATIDYFNQLVKKSHDKTCLVFDDIHWSKEMSEAWNEICEDYRVTLSIDIYQLGIVFLNPEIRKQHYIIRY